MKDNRYMYQHKTKYIFLIILLFLGIGSGRAQQNAGQTYHFNLQKCIEYAYEHHDSLKNAKLDIENAKYKVKETTGSGFPQISSNINLQDYLKLPTSLLPGEFFGQPGTFIPVKFGVKYQSSVGFNIDQLLFDGSYLVGLQASKTYKELSERNYNRTKISTTVAVTKAYYQVLVSGEQLKLLDANINQLKQLLSQTTELNKQGFAEKIDVDRLTVQQNNLVTTRENVERLLAFGYQLLKFQMGMPVNENLVIEDRIEDIKFESEITLSGKDTTAYRARVEYGLLETQKKLNELDLKRYKSQYLPSVSAFGNTAINYQNNTFGNLYSQSFPMTLIGLKINIPIYSGGQRLYRVKQAEVNVLKTQNILDLVKNAINLEMDLARTQYLNNIASLNNQKQNIDLAHEVLRVANIKYEQGLGSNIEVTQAQTLLEQSENNYIQALYNALISKVDIEKASGKITY
jgi:outer membrane protein